MNAVTIRFKRAGGADAGSGLYVAFHNEEEDDLICSDETDTDTDVMFAAECDVEGYGGQAVTMLLGDADNSTPWGRVYIDDIRFLDAKGEEISLCSGFFFI